MFSARWTWLALTLTPVLSQAATAEPVPLTRVFQDWRVACDNTRRCTAVSGSTDNPGMGLYIVREAGAKGSTRVSVISYDDVALRYEFHLDGRPTEQWKYGSKGREYYYLEGDAAIEKLRELRNSDTLSSNSNFGERRVSLQGLSTTLLLMDSVQGRIGHPSALVRPGYQPDSRVPPAPAIPKLPRFTLAPALSDAEQQVIGNVAIARSQQELSQGPNESWQVQPDVYPLDPNHALVRLRYDCADDGCQHIFYRVSRSQPYEAIPLALNAPAGVPFTLDLYGNIDFNPVSGQLKMRRDSGKDCGESSIWQYDGAAMQLKDYRQMWHCESINEEYWPVTWRAKG